MIISLSALGGYFYLKDNQGDVSQLGWLPLASLVVYVLSFSLGFGPIPWLMMGEILPAKIRGSAASVATGFNWSCTFIVTKTFKDIIGKRYANMNIQFSLNKKKWFFRLLFSSMRFIRCILDIWNDLSHWFSVCHTKGTRDTREKLRRH